MSLILGNAVLGLIGMLGSGQLAKLSRVPYPVLGAVIIPLSILSAFQETQHWSAIPIILVFTTIGLLMKSYKWPRPPLILGFILGEIIEKNGMSAISLFGIGCRRCHLLHPHRQLRKNRPAAISNGVGGGGGRG